MEEAIIILNVSLIMKLLFSSLASIAILSLLSFKKYTDPSIADHQVAFSMEDESATGSFANPKGTVVFDESDLSKTRIDICIKANTIQTGDPGRDKHLKNEDFFEVGKYPEIRFKSTSTIKNADGSYSIKGDFTMKSTTKSVEISARVVNQDGQRLLLGQLPINRVDYKVGIADDGVGTLLTAHLKYPN